MSFAETLLTVWTGFASAASEKASRQQRHPVWPAAACLRHHCSILRTAPPKPQKPTSPMDLLTRQITNCASISSRTDQPIAKEALHSTHSLQVAYLLDTAINLELAKRRHWHKAWGFMLQAPNRHCPSVLLFLKRSSAPNCSPPAPYTASCTPQFPLSIIS